MIQMSIISSWCKSWILEMLLKEIHSKCNLTNNRIRISFKTLKIHNSNKPVTLLLLIKKIRRNHYQNETERLSQVNNQHLQANRMLNKTSSHNSNNQVETNNFRHLFCSRNWINSAPSSNRIRHSRVLVLQIQFKDKQSNSYHNSSNRIQQKLKATILKHRRLINKKV